MKSSRIPGFYKKTVEERRELLRRCIEFSDEDLSVLSSQEALPIETADKMIENVIGTFPLTFRIRIEFPNKRERLYYTYGS